MAPPFLSHADGEAAAGNLLGVSFVDFRHYLLESGGVKPIGKNGGIADNVRKGNQGQEVP